MKHFLEALIVWSVKRDAWKRVPLSINWDRIEATGSFTIPKWSLSGILARLKYGNRWPIKA